MKPVFVFFPMASEFLPRAREIGDLIRDALPHAEIIYNVNYEDSLYSRTNVDDEFCVIIIDQEEIRSDMISMKWGVNIWECTLDEFLDFLKTMD